MEAWGSVVARFCGVVGCPIASFQTDSQPAEDVGTELVRAKSRGQALITVARMQFVARLQMYRTTNTYSHRYITRQEEARLHREATMSNTS